MCKRCADRNRILMYMAKNYLLIVQVDFSIYSPTHRAGLFGRRRPLSACDEFGVTDVYLKPHNRLIFLKTIPMTDLCPFCTPMGQNGGQKSQLAAVSFKIVIGH